MPIIFITCCLSQIEKEYVHEWEKALECQYKYDYFFAVICNSIENGPQGIDISYNKDIFSMPKDYTAVAKLINHEFGIYLLKDVLSETRAFKDFSCYKITESLAEYFNRTITGGHYEFDWNDEYINFYRFLRDNNPSIGTKEMYLKAEEKFVSK